MAKNIAVAEKSSGENNARGTVCSIDVVAGRKSSEGYHRRRAGAVGRQPLAAVLLEMNGGGVSSAAAWL